MGTSDTNAEAESVAKRRRTKKRPGKDIPSPRDKQQASSRLHHYITLSATYASKHIQKGYAI